MTGKRKANQDSSLQQQQRVLKNPRVKKHCNKCESVTTHTIRKSGQQMCVTCDNKNTHNYSATNKNQPAVRVCPLHPNNTHRDPTGGHCGCCWKASSLASTARQDDKKHKRVCTDPSGPTSSAFINSLQGDLCDVCLNPCYVLYTPGVPNHPWCLSVGRRRTGIAHDCNRENMVAEHNLCNKFKHVLSDQETDKVLLDGWRFAVNGGKIDPNLPDSVLPSHKRGKQVFGKDLLKVKRHHAKRKGQEFDKATMTLEWLEHQHDKVQKGCCAACGGLLGTNISFNRIDPTNHVYTSTNVNLMHNNCNTGLNNWPMAELHNMFLKAYQNRHPDEFQRDTDAVNT